MLVGYNWGNHYSYIALIGTLGNGNMYTGINKIIFTKIKNKKFKGENEND